MRSLVIIILFIAAFVINARAQWGQVVIHKDLIPQLGVNTGYQVAANNQYKDTMAVIQKYRGDIAGYSAGILMVQQTIYKNLTNVDDAVRNGKTIYYTTKLIPKILNNLMTASIMAAGKPYLAQYAIQYVTTMTLRIKNIQQEIHDFILNDNPKALIDQTDRDRLLFSIYENIDILYNLSNAIIEMFSIYNLQDAMNNVVSYQSWYNQDFGEVYQILNEWKF